MEIKINITFKSDLFPPCDGEDEEVNSGRYGKKLAEYIHGEIQKYGIEVEDIYSEDWGWAVSVKNKDFPVWIGCGNYEEYKNVFFVLYRTFKAIC